MRLRAICLLAVLVAGFCTKLVDAAGPKLVTPLLHDYNFEREVNKYPTGLVFVLFYDGKAPVAARDSDLTTWDTTVKQFRIYETLGFFRYDAKSDANDKVWLV